MKNLIACSCAIAMCASLSLFFVDAPTDGSYDYYLSTIIHFIFFRLLLGYGDK